MNLDKSMQEAWASLAATAEYSVFRGRAPGPRQSLGVGPSPGPGVRVHGEAVSNAGDLSNKVPSYMAKRPS